MDEPEMMACEGGEEDIGSVLLSQFQSSRRKKDHYLCEVVGTISQELRDHGVPLTPVAYFATVSSTIENLCRDPYCGPDPSLKALLTFLSMVLPAVSPAVVKSKGGQVGETLKRFLEFGTAEEGAVKAALKCISRLLVDGDKAKWSSVCDLYEVLLGFVIDRREKVRIQAHSYLRDVLQSFQGTSVLSPASKNITYMFERCILLAARGNSDDTSTVQGPRGAWDVLFILNALKENLPLMSNKFRTEIIKNFRSLLWLQNPIVTRAIMEVLHALCCSSTAEVPAEILLDLLCSLESSSTNKEKSADAMASTARLLHVGIKKVNDVNRSICVVKLPEIFTALADILASEHEEAIFSATEALKGLIRSCIDESLIEQGVDRIRISGQLESAKSRQTIIERICQIMERLLDHQYSAVWDMSFQVISEMFDRLGHSSSYLMVGAIQSLASLEKKSDGVYRKQLHDCVGSAVRGMGPEMFLDLVPLNLEFEDLSKANIWLLPILKQYIVGARLSFFSGSILSMARLMQLRSEGLEREGRVIDARTARGIVYSLWSLMPAFCNYPPDTADSFNKDFQGKLCGTLRNEPDFRGLICSGLQILIEQNKGILRGNNEGSGELSLYEQKAKEDYTPQVAEKNLKEIGSALSFFSVLSDVILTSSKDSGGWLQSTIREFASIADKESVKKYFKIVMHRLVKVTVEATRANNAGSSSSMLIDNSSGEISLSVRRGLFLDISVSLLPGLDVDEINLLYKVVKDGIQVKEAIFQKKSYKTLSVILKERSDFFMNKLDELHELMRDSLSACHFSSKRHRLDCLYFLIICISKDPSVQQKQEIIRSFLIEIILALKEGNKKTRNKAFDLLVKAGHAWGNEEEGHRKEHLQQFFNMIAANLVGGTPHMISAAVKGLARLAYEFSDLISAAYNLLPFAFSLLQRENREVCKANLGLVKVLVAKSQLDSLHTHLKTIIEGLLNWQDDTKNHFKAKVKSLLEMLARRCGLDTVKAVMPEEHMKLLTHIRKTVERKERKAKSEKDADSIYSRTSSRHSRWNHTSIFSDVADEDGDGDSDVEYVNSKSVSGLQSKASYALSSEASLSRSKRLRKSSKSLPGDLLDKLEGQPLDMLDRQNMISVLKSSPHKRKAESDDELEINPDGRLVIHDGQRKVKREKPRSSDNDSDIRSNTGSHMTAGSLTRAKQKRQRTNSGWAYRGSEYKSKKASGDLKRMNKLDPYAYWPLDRKLLNRREESKAVARKGMASVMKVTKRLEGKSAAAALSVKGLKRKRTQKKGIKKKHK